MNKTLLFHLANRKLGVAAEIFRRLATDPDWVERHLRAVLAQSEAEGSAPAFLDMLMLSGETSFGNLRVIAYALELAARTGRADVLLRRVSALEAVGRLPAADISLLDCLHLYSRVCRQPGPMQLDLLCKLKYRGLAEIGTQNLAQAAEFLADRMYVNLRLAELLFAVSKYRHLQREVWTRRLKLSSGLNQILRDWDYLTRLKNGGPRVVGGVDAFVNIEAVHAAFHDLKPGKGALVVDCHGGFSAAAIQMFRLAFADGQIFRFGPPGANYISARNPRSALFMGTRAIEDGKCVLIAADAGLGNLAASMRILDRDFPAAEGAPFMAYETGCDTFWLGAAWRGNQFVPVVVPGPTRGEGENYRAFRTRWLAFYAAQIESQFTGDPLDLAMSQAWANALVLKAGGRVGFRAGHAAPLAGAPGP